jgi:hypothetical protein
MIRIQCSVSRRPYLDGKHVYEFEVAPATTAEEVKQIAAAGFEKVDDIYAIHVFRRT